MTDEIPAPITVARGPDCAFYRSLDDAMRADPSEDAAVFDAVGRRLTRDGAVHASGGSEELARLLRDWLGHMDALRESTANWPLELLLRASVEHLGYS